MPTPADAPVVPVDSYRSVTGLVDPAGPPAMEELVEQVLVRYGEASQQRQRLAALLSANRMIIDELSLPAVHAMVLQQACSLAAVESAALAVLAPAGVTQVLQLPAGAAGLPAAAVPVAVEADVLAALTEVLSDLASGQIAPVTLPAALVGAPATAAPMPARWRRRCLALPIHHRTTLVAVLLLAVAAGGDLSAGEEELLVGMAITAGIAAENARLYEESRSRQRWLARAAELTHEVLSCATRTEALHLIAASTHALADADLVTLWVPTPPRRLRVAFTVGEAQPATPDLQASIDDELVMAVSHGRHGACVRVPEHPGSALLAPMPLAGIDSALVVPLTGHQAVAAVVVVGRRPDRPTYGDLDLDLVEVFARQMALALEVRAGRTVQARVAVLEDRERIACDLHDHVIQRLFAAGLRLHAVPAATDAARRELDLVMADLDGTLQQLRSSIYQLRSTAEDSGGLRAAVLEVAQQVTPVLGFAPTLHFEGPVDELTDPQLTEQAVAVIREATTNAGKHAAASEVTVHVSAATGQLTLLVADNGSGLGPTGRCSGLGNLHRRAELLGGTLTFDTPACGGTQLCWTVPV